jgi:hypothetical protein
METVVERLLKAGERWKTKGMEIEQPGCWA